VYPHSDLAALEPGLQESSGARRRQVDTDGVFSMEGDLARLPELVELCRRYDAVLLVDDSHGLGVMGPEGRGTASALGVHGEVDVVTGTLGKALGGAAGGFVAASEPVIALMSQLARPGLFSNALPVTVACSARAALSLLRADPGRVAGCTRSPTGCVRDCATPGCARWTPPARSCRSSWVRPRTRSA
jgi:glycine C-acetyltransferase